MEWYDVWIGFVKHEIWLVELVVLWNCDWVVIDSNLGEPKLKP